jgi:hypothetical protein
MQAVNYQLATGKKIAELYGKKGTGSILCNDFIGFDV